MVQLALHPPSADPRQQGSGPQVSPAPAGLIRVHLLNGRTRRPMKGEELWVVFFGAAGKSTDPGIKQSDNQGGAVIPIPPGSYYRLNAIVPDTSKMFVACSQTRFCISDVLSKGIRPKNYCSQHGNNPEATAAVQPGDLYIYARPVGGLEWAWHETFFSAPGISRIAGVAPLCLRAKPARKACENPKGGPPPGSDSGAAPARRSAGLGPRGPKPA